MHIFEGILFFKATNIHKNKLITYLLPVGFLRVDVCEKIIVCFSIVCSFEEDSLEYLHSVLIFLIKKRFVLFVCFLTFCVL